MLGKIFGSPKKDQMVKAKQDYEKACSATGDSREVVAARIRVGLRSRAVIDKTFIEAAEKTSDHWERCMIAVASGHERPTGPSATSFQTIKSVNGDLMAFIPLEHAEEIFKIGAAFQLEEISAEQAIELAQAVADKISEEIHLSPPIQALGFLREELAEGEGDNPQESVDENDSETKS